MADTELTFAAAVGALIKAGSPRKCVHLEAGKWVWDGPDSAAATHYLIPDISGALIARPTAIPIPGATPSLTW